MARKRRTAATGRNLNAITVVFDFGGVLAARFDADTAIHAETGGDLEEVRTAYWAERERYDRGELTADEYWRLVGAAAGLEDMSEDELAHLQEVDARTWLTLQPESRDLIHDLARNGIRMAVLSNASAEFGEELRRADWFEAMSFALISGEEGVAKPDLKIYETLLETLSHETGGVERPADVIFFDDLAANVEAAQTLGIDAHRWPRNSTLTHSGEQPGWEIARQHLAARGIPLD